MPFYLDVDEPVPVPPVGRRTFRIRNGHLEMVLPDGSAQSIAPPSINNNIRYVHPNGDDENAGTDWGLALKYVTTAWTQLHALGGGTIYIADNTRIAPDDWPVKGLHINARQAEAGDIPGAVLPMPVNLIGVSPGTGQVRGKTNSPTVTLLGGAVAPDSDDQDDPALWMVGGPFHAYPFYMENIRFQNGTNKCIRHSWDYAVRDFAGDGSIVKQPVTHATRAAGQTVFTVDPYSFAVTHVSRTSNVLKVTLANRVQAAGQQAYIDYTGEDFTPGWHTIIGYATQDSFADSILVASTGDDFDDASPTAEVLGTCLQAKDYLTVYSTNAEWPSTVYRVVSVDEDEITVEDPYGYAPRSASADDDDIGTYAAQDRGTFPYDRWEWDTIAGTTQRDSEPASDRFCAGPTVDIGSTQFFTVRQTSFDGYNLPAVDDDYSVKSRERRAAVLFDGGQGALGTGEWNHHFGERGGFVIHCSPILPNGFPLIRIGQDMDETIKPVPTIEIINAQNFSKWLIIGAEIADNGSGVATIRTDNERIYYKAITCIDTYGTVDGFVHEVSTAPAYAFGTAPYNYLGRTGWYGYDRTIAGRHLAAARAGGPITNPMTFPSAENPQNSANWEKTPAGITFTTTGIPDPWGNTGTGAIRIANPTGTDGSVVFFANGVGGAPANGNFFAATMWMRSTSESLLKGGSGAFLLRVTDNDQEEVFLSSRAYFPNSEGAAEWCQPIAGGPISNASGGVQLVIWETEIVAGGSVDVYLPTLYYRPASDDFTAYEAYEWLTHIQPCPYYLPTGECGTRPGQKFFAHGGLATAARYTVGGGSGDITLGAANGDAVEIFDEEGNSLGVLPLFAFTVNP